MSRFLGIRGPDRTSEAVFIQSAQDIARLGKQLPERIVRLAEHWANVGEKLGKAVDAYNSALPRSNLACSFLRAACATSKPRRRALRSR
jgi:hypothetical protein